MESPFPKGTLDQIMKYPGNLKCCDCPSLNADWGNINHGTFVCLECAGKHRALGVQVSFIRSIHMDTWNPVQVKYSVVIIQIKPCYICTSILEIRLK